MVHLSWIICVIYVLCLSCFRVCSLLPCGHLLGKCWLIGSCLWCLIVFLSLSHVVSWVKCGTWLYRFLIFAAFLTFIKTKISTQQYIQLNTGAKEIKLLKPGGHYNRHSISTATHVKPRWAWAKTSIGLALLSALLIDILSKQVYMTRKYHNHRPQTKHWYTY